MKNDGDKQNLILAYNKLKEQMDNERGKETLRKFRILSKAYDLGLKIYGRGNFSVERLSTDFELPYTTTKRVLSLRKANKRTWGLIKDKKISAFKVAMCLMRKDTTFQDEVIDMVIKDNLSTFQIRSLKVRNLEDIKKERLKVAVERGFYRNDVANKSFNYALDRLEELLKLKKENLPQSKIPFLIKRLKQIRLKIDDFIKINS